MQARLSDRYITVVLRLLKTTTHLAAPRGWSTDMSLLDQDIIRVRGTPLKLGKKTKVKGNGVSVKREIALVPPATSSNGTAQTFHTKVETTCLPGHLCNIASLKKITRLLPGTTCHPGKFDTVREKPMVNKRISKLCQIKPQSKAHCHPDQLSKGVIQTYHQTVVTFLPEDSCNVASLGKTVLILLHVNTCLPGVLVDVTPLCQNTLQVPDTACLLGKFGALRDNLTGDPRMSTLCQTSPQKKNTCHPEKQSKGTTQIYPQAEVVCAPGQLSSVASPIW